MANLLRRIITTKLKCINQLQSNVHLMSNRKILVARIHYSAICQTEKEIMLRIIQQEKKTPEIIKEPKRDPYIKNMLLAKVDKDLIVYPQVLDKQRYMFLDEVFNAITAYFATEVDGALLDKTGQLPATVLKDLKALGLFGLIIPQEYGGLGFCQTEFCKIAEAFAVNPSISLSLIAHQCLAAKAILNFGTEDQKNKYLPLMASGEKIGAFCFTEEFGGSDPSSLQAKLDIDTDADIFTLNGTKTWVTNGRHADIFIVVAKDQPDPVGDEALTAVIVDTVENNVTVEPQMSVGMKGAGLAKVTFTNTYLNGSDLLGTRRGGLQLALDVCNFARIGIGAICSGMSKHLIEECNKYINERHIYNMKMSELGNVREKILRMSAQTYGIESFTYFVSALDDLYEEQDYTVESSALKLTATNMLLENCDSCLKILAARGCDESFPYQRHLRDAMSLSNFLGANDVTNLIIALDCLEYCGNNMSTLILKKRRILEHPTFNLKQLYRRAMRISRKNPDMTMEMEYLIHPILVEEAKDVEKIILYLSYGIEKSLVYFGSKVASENHQFITSRIGSCAALSIMFLPALSRASRSVCLGLPESMIEAELVKYLFKMHGHVANHYIGEIFTGIDCLDINRVHDISNTLVNAKSYTIKSPFFRTLW